MVANVVLTEFGFMAYPLLLRRSTAAPWNCTRVTLEPEIIHNGKANL
jgi:hypothetical protein